MQGPADQAADSDIIDLTSDDSKDSNIINLLGDSSDEVLLGSSINCSPVSKWVDDCHDERFGLIVPEVPPPQEIMERLRDMPIREEDKWEANRVAGLLVQARLGLPVYKEDNGAPPYTGGKGL